MIKNTTLVVRLQKHPDWMPDEHGWKIPLLAVPGVQVLGVEHDSGKVDPKTYRINYRHQLLYGSGVQYFDLLHVRLRFRHELTARFLLILTVLIAAVLMMLFWYLPREIPMKQKQESGPKDTLRVYVPVYDSEKKTTKRIPEQQELRGKPKTQNPNFNISFIANTSAKNDSLRREIIVLIGEIPDSSGPGGNAVRDDIPASQALAEVLRLQGGTIYTAFFHPPIYSNDLFRRMLGGDFSAVPLSAIHHAADEICVGSIYRHVRPSQIQAGMFTAELTFSCCFFSAASGRMLQHYSRSFSKIGFSSAHASTLANEALKTLFMNDFKK